MGSSCGNGSPKANTSPQDIDLQHDSLKSKLKYGSSSNLNFMVGLVAKKGASAAASSFDGGMLPAIFKKNQITFQTFAHKIYLLVDIYLVLFHPSECYTVSMFR